jgi:oxygen-independent coproporphyrinogen III oxidase
VATESVALYAHFPYCVSICPYCDFDRQASGFASIPRYLAALVAEIGRLSPRPVHSIFFGGGTPSLMDPDQVRELIRVASEALDLAADCEITLEANPSECTRDRLTGFRRAGVNRLSVGVQSFDDATLALLGRRHGADDARDAVRAATQAGIENVSLDLMLGLPGMTVDTWQETLEQAAALQPEHLSCYILTVDERVPMGRDVAAGRLALPSDDSIADQYQTTQRLLASLGYRQYEISNWAGPGFEGRHNLTYWRDQPYVGVGAGAAGWCDGVRWKNSPSPRRYMATVATGRAERVEEERPDSRTQMHDFLAMGLRLREGIDAGRFARRFGVDLEMALGQDLLALRAAGILEGTASGCRVTEGSVLVTNEVVVRLQQAVDAWWVQTGGHEHDVAEADQSALVTGRSS